MTRGGPSWTPLQQECMRRLCEVPPLKGVVFENPRVVASLIRHGYVWRVGGDWGHVWAATVKGREAWAAFCTDKARLTRAYRPWDETVVIDYTNHRGVRRERVVEPLRLVFEKNEWYPKEQWLLVAWDTEKNAKRTFAMKNICSWRPA